MRSCEVILEGIEYPQPSYSKAVYPKNKGDEEKVAQGLLRLSEEDPTIRFKTNNETHEMILTALGEQHIDVIVSKLKSKFGVEVTLSTPKVAYRETIRKRLRHKASTRNKLAVTDNLEMSG